MGWFTSEAASFLADLKQNNSREWFHENKKRYELTVRKPMEVFAGEMIGRMLEIDPTITATPKSAVFRIHRDTRFGNNKAPYKENAAMVIAPGGKHEPGVTGLYFSMDSERLFIASGHYFREPDQLTKICRHIINEATEFQRLLADPRFVEHFQEIQGARNKMLPPEFKEAAASHPLVYNKQFFYAVEHPIATIERQDLADFVMDHMRACQDLNVFLTTPLKRD